MISENIYLLLFEMLFYLSAILALIVLVLKYVLPKFGFGQRFKNSRLKIVEMRSLGARREIWLIDIDAMHFMLGVTDHHVSLIEKWSDAALLVHDPVVRSKSLDE